MFTMRPSRRYRSYLPELPRAPVVSLDVPLRSVIQIAVGPQFPRNHVTQSRLVAPPRVTAATVLARGPRVMQIASMAQFWRNHATQSYLPLPPRALQVVVERLPHLVVSRGHELRRSVRQSQLMLPPRSIVVVPSIYRVKFRQSGPIGRQRQVQPGDVWQHGPYLFAEPPPPVPSDFRPWAAFLQSKPVPPAPRYGASIFVRPHLEAHGVRVVIGPRYSFDATRRVYVFVARGSYEPVHTFTKQPGESYGVAVDFYKHLPPGAILSAGTASATRADTGTDATSTVLETTVLSILGTKAMAKVQAGTDGVAYKIRYLVQATPGAVLEEEIYMVVRES